MSSSQNRTRSGNRAAAPAAAQASADAVLDAEFEKSERPFDYSASVGATRSLPGDDGSSSSSSSVVCSYLERMRRGQLIQPFGCLIAVEESSFGIIAYSENAADMLDLTPHAVPSMEQKEAITMGTDARTLFSPQSAAALQKAASFGEVNLLNPILVNCRSSGKPFYAILHRTDAALVMDLEPVNMADAPVTAAGALKSYKLAAKAISELQSLPSGDVKLLCDVLAREVRDLTGYDRVMVYKFHEDEHGEVVAECKRPELEPYLGLHYPATDIPQASRFLFVKNKVRMICDCSAPPGKVIQDKRLAQPVNLCGSTLRAPHGCHARYMANMGSIASLVLSVTIGEDDVDYLGNHHHHHQQQRRRHQKEKKLWGLVVCHHTSPKVIPFPLRYACEFLIQVFGIQLDKEVELAARARENHLLQTQAVLCDMLLRDAPIGIVTQSPNVMDIIKCDGAALYYRDRLWMLGVTPTESQIRDIAIWISESHGGTTGLSTDSLVEAGYPRASELGDFVCGMAAIKITRKDFLFWFRSHAAKEIKWGGAVYDPMDTDDVGGKMHPRSSFKAFLEVAKQRSLPWKDVEMDAVHSLQLILRGSLEDALDTNTNEQGSIQCIDELQTIMTEMVRVIETASVPILAVDTSGNVNGWNVKLAELTGLSAQQAIGIPLIELVDDSSVEVITNTLFLAFQGKEEKNIEFKLKRLGDQKCNGPLTLVANTCCSRDSKSSILGVSFVAQDVTGQKKMMDKYARIQGDYIAIVRNPNNLIPPLFMIDEYGVCVEWNTAMQNLSGLKRQHAINKILIGEVFSCQNFGCQVKDIDMLTKLKIIISSKIAGEETDKLHFCFFNMRGKHVETLLFASRKTTSAGRITGVVCFLHVAGPELHHAMRCQTETERVTSNSLRELAYIRQEIQKSLHGVKFMTKLLEHSNLSLKQRQILRRRTLCQEQLAKIMDGVDLLKDEESSFDLDNTKFNLAEALETIKFQVMNVSRERQIPLIYHFPEEVSSMYLYGDNLRLQQILSDFLLAALQFTQPTMGSVMLQLNARQEQFGLRSQMVHLEFRIVHPAPGIPDALIQEMFRHKSGSSRDGLVLHICQKLVKMMDGALQYLREADSSSFIIVVKFPLAQHTTS